MVFCINTGCDRMIHIVLGAQGSGKTLYMVQVAYKAYQAGKQVYSNIALKFPYKQLTYDDIVDCKLRDCIIIIDEIHQLLPARNSISKESREIVDGFLSMVRKANVEVYGSTQTIRKIDVRLREELDYLYTCRKYFYLKGKWTEILHTVSADADTLCMISVKGLQVFNNTEISLCVYANPYYNLYDTYQIIKIKRVKRDNK